jgi:hypothetical protein
MTFISRSKPRRFIKVREQSRHNRDSVLISNQDIEKQICLHKYKSNITYYNFDQTLLNISDFISRERLLTSFHCVRLIHDRARLDFFSFCTLPPFFRLPLLVLASSFFLFLRFLLIKLIFIYA